MARRAAMSWEGLARMVATSKEVDFANGPTNAYSRLRLFGHQQDQVRVTLFRDNHAWCPYCQKVWLFMEERQIPYRIEKVTMFCYGNKEKWYKKLVPSGMLPAITLDGRTITDSDRVLTELEAAFGVVGKSLHDSEVVPLRRLERHLYGAWCSWLCRPGGDEQRRAQYESAIGIVETVLGHTPGPYFLEEFSVVDVIFTPMLERQNASLFYYKGYSVRCENSHPNITRWFKAMEQRETYRGTQSDFHTHVHDLPPQLGGCYENGTAQQVKNRELVNEGPYNQIPEVGFPAPDNALEVALTRMLLHRTAITSKYASQCRMSEADVDQALRCALTNMVSKEEVTPPAGTDVALRSLRDRISVPRDMPIHSAQLLKATLERTAALEGSRPGPIIPTEHRRDHSSVPFRKTDRAVWSN